MKHARHSIPQTLFWAFLMAVGMLAGCATYEPRPLTPVQSETDFRARSLTNAALAQFVKANFTDPAVEWPPQDYNLRSLTVAALYYNPALAIARARLAEAVASEITAGVRPNPNLSFLPTYVVNSFPDEVPYMFGASLDVPIETGGKRKRRLEQAREAIRVAQWTAAEAIWGIRVQLRQALLEYQFARRELGLAQSEEKLHTELLTALEDRFKAGDISHFELSTAQGEALTARIATRAAETRVADARLGIATAIGIPVTALEGVEFKWEGLESPPTNLSRITLQGAGLLNRLDVQRALAEYAASDASLRLEIAKQYPDIHLDPGYEFDQGEHKFSLGPSVNLPIFDRNQGPIAEARTRREEAGAAFLKLQADAIQETDKAMVDYKSALAEWAEADHALKEYQEKIEKTTQRSLELGEADRSALLYAEQQGLTARRARFDALRKVQDALGALENAIQHPLYDSRDWQAIAAAMSLLNPSRPGNSTRK